MTLGESFTLFSLPFSPLLPNQLPYYYYYYYCYYYYYYYYYYP